MLNGVRLGAKEKIFVKLDPQAKLTDSLLAFPHLPSSIAEVKV